MKEYMDQVCPLCGSGITEDDEVVVCDKCGTPHHKACWEANQGCAAAECQISFSEKTGNMDKYIGKICPFCKTRLTAEDEIVICSDCEMPHHKDCWIANKGCTTFGCQGTIQGVVFEPEVSVSEAPKYSVRDAAAENTVRMPAFCVYCGEPLKRGASFCEKCGKPVMIGHADATNNRADYPAAPASGIRRMLQKTAAIRPEDPEITELVGTNAEYYINVFQRIREKGEYRIWNWPAFLVTPFWMMYRKMYVFGAVIAGAEMIMMLLSSVLSVIVGLCVAVAGGLLGNCCYLYDISKRLEKSGYYPSEYRAMYLGKWKDVDIIVPSISVFAYILVSILVIL